MILTNWIEKIDWAYDVVTLFLLGSINEVSKEVAEFVYAYYVCKSNFAIR